MPESPFGLSAKEVEVLRLLARGHDAKSAASALGLSVHTVNERLREARFKTGSGSSRAAARLLAEKEDPKKFGSSKLGVSGLRNASEQPNPPHIVATDGSRFPSRREIFLMMSAVFITALLAGFIAISNQASTPPAPQVASTFPAANAIIEPGRIRLSVTYDRPMRPQSYSFVQKSTETYSQCSANQPAVSTDHRTFTLVCDIRPGHRYEIWFNSPPYMNFVDDKGVAAIPYGLRFRTRKATTTNR